MNEKPLVTVYLTTFNRETLLKRAVKSVIDQDYSNLELIIVDDCSLDGTAQYLENLSSKNEFIKYLKNEVNSGACFSRNRAIEIATGSFITGLDDDDYFCASHISSFLNKWEQKESNIIAFYPNFYRDLQGKKKRSTPRLNKCRARDLICSNWIGNQIFTTTEVLKNIGGFDERFPAWQDYECWYRLLHSSGMMAECTGSYTYVQDASHSHQRISSSSSEKILVAWNMFSKKHKLSKKENEVTKLMLVSYGMKNVPLRNLWWKFLSMPNYINMRNSLIIFLKKMK